VSAPRISIITPSLNQCAYLERTIVSVLENGYPNVEYIVVDGGSSDGSVEIIERYAAHLAYWVSEPDRGQAHAINKGLARATGEIVAYINSDDYYLPGAFAAAADAMRRQGVRWVAGRCRYEHADGTLETLYVPKPPSMPRRTLIRETWYVPQASSFWRRDVFDDVGPLREDLQYVFDLEFGLRCALSGVTPTCIDYEVAVRYLHDEAKSATPERFAIEYRSVQGELEAAFERRGDATRDLGYRALRRARRIVGRRPRGAFA
jgi:glycosyltransferase involved in cell wall biosynthesis